jgi:hypothetical protein
MKIICAKCGIEFKTFACYIRKGGGKYCSRSCAGTARVSKLELINDLRRVARDLGHRPTMIEYSQHGKYSATLVVRIGGIQRLWESMGLLYKDNRPLTSTDLNSVLADLQRLRKQLGHLPTSWENRQFGAHSYETIFKYLQVNTWHEALIKAFDLSGLEAATVTPPKQRTLDMWLEVLRNLAQELGRVPSTKEVRASISWRPEVYPILKGKSLKSWLEAAGIDARECITRLARDDELIADVIRVARQLRQVPNTTLYNKHGGYNQATVSLRIGWGKAQELAAQAIELRPVNQPIKELSKVADPVRDKLKESSVEAIKGFFQGK